LTAGDVEIDVLHPPADGPDGNENARSLVLLVQHAGHRLLLTGDLEGPGLERVLRLPPVQVDVLQAPHHGSRAANTPELADWARPRHVIASHGQALRTELAAEPYLVRGIDYVGTGRHGAITVRSSEDGLWVETFRPDRNEKK
jgi:competence protein ComEC